MNELPKAKVALLRQLLAHGVSYRAIALAVPCAKPTVCRYAKIFSFSPICACGKPAGHRGWCEVRLVFSPRRRGFLADQWRKRKDSELTKIIDKAVSAATARGHVLGPFIWSEPGTVSLAYAICTVCGSRVSIQGSKFHYPFSGWAVERECESPEFIAAKRAARKDKALWHEGRQLLWQVRRALRNPSRSRSAASTPEPTSHP